MCIIEVQAAQSNSSTNASHLRNFTRALAFGPGHVRKGAEKFSVPRNSQRQKQSRRGPQPNCEHPQMAMLRPEFRFPKSTPKFDATPASGATQVCSHPRTTSSEPGAPVDLGCERDPDFGLQGMRHKILNFAIETGTSVVQYRAANAILKTESLTIRLWASVRVPGELIHVFRARKGGGSKDRNHLAVPLCQEAGSILDFVGKVNERPRCFHSPRHQAEPESPTVNMRFLRA